MPKFSGRSKKKMQSLDPRLCAILNQAIKHVDFTIIHTHRGQMTQDALYATGASKLKYPDSKHNHNPSYAVDIAPYPIDWDNRGRFIYLAGIIMGIAIMKGVTIRWGGDWNENYDPSDESFWDACHFELVIED